MTEERDNAAAPATEKTIEMQLTEFLESSPPSQIVMVHDLAEFVAKSSSSRSDHIRTPELQLHCTHAMCNGLRFFRVIETYTPDLHTMKWEYFYITYRCSNCQQVTKVFFLAAKVDSVRQSSGQVYKFGELPSFGPPTPARLIALVGPDRDDFLKGRRCEIQGLGIGAFTYYRRVVENQKNRILDEVIKVAEKLGAGVEAMAELRAARSETQFSKALSMVKAAIPQVLLINGQNPLALLHSALSEGVHDRSDEECLAIASSVRVVLGELSERMAQAMKDEAEISKALSTLMNRNR
jgi:hypothetical protein